MINKVISCLLYLLHVRVTLFLLRHVLKYRSIQVIRGERSPGSDTSTIFKDKDSLLERKIIES